MKNQNKIRNAIFTLAGIGMRSSISQAECKMIQQYLSGKEI